MVFPFPFLTLWLSVLLAPAVPVPSARSYTALFCAVTNSHGPVVAALLTAAGIVVDKPVFSETPLCRAAVSATSGIMQVG